MSATLPGFEQMMDVQLVARDIETEHIALATTDATNQAQLLKAYRITLGDPDGMRMHDHADANWLSTSWRSSSASMPPAISHNVISVRS